MLRGDRTVRLRKDASGKTRARSTRQREAFTVDSKDQGLWETLRQCRRELAQEAGVPPYVIFHDATLKEMLHRRPVSLEEMLAIHGVGQAKLARYGAAFLDALRGEENAERANTPGSSAQEETREGTSWPDP